MRLISSKRLDQYSKSEWRSFFIATGLWLLLNFMLFLGNYLLNGHPDHILPFWGTLEEFGWRGVLFFNDNHHPFRISGDWFLLSLVSAVLIRRISRKSLNWFVSILYFLLFSYSLYYGIYVFIYGAHPNFSSNALLISNVFPIFLGTLGIPKWIFFIVAMGACALTFYLVWRLQLLFLNHLEKSSGHIIRKLLIASCIIYLVSGQLLYSNSDHPSTEHNIRWWTADIRQSSKSLPTYDWNTKNEQSREISSRCNKLNRDSIDLYLLVIESYGAVATEAPVVAEEFRPFLDSVGYLLKKDGWSTASGYSISPIKGGRSWLSFSTIMTGQKIDNQYAYEHFLAHGKDYPHLFNCLKENGFHTTWMNTMRPPKKAGLGIQDSLLKNVWGCDRWIQYSDIEYSGRIFDPYGGIPDQYALNVYREQQAKNKGQPHFLFFINTGSHSPWYAPPPIVGDHSDLNKTEGWHSNGFELSSFDNYEQSMRYQIGYITHYIRKWGDANDLFVLVGDHQPPAMEHRLEDRIHLAAVPYHVISKNEELVRAFFAQKANPGLTPMHKDSILMRHEQLYETLLITLE